MDQRTVASVFVAVATSIFLGAVALREHQAPEFASSASVPCSPSPKFKIVDLPGPKTVIAQGKGFDLNGFGWLVAKVCSPGTLVINARGDTLDGIGPQMFVSVEDRSIFEGEVVKQRTIKVDVPNPGTIKIAYLNDASKRDVRVATFSHVSFAGVDCNKFSGVKGENWNAARQLAVLVDTPLTLTPCAAGQLSFRLSGRAGNGAYPVVTVAQGGRTLLSRTTTTEASIVSVKVTSRPVTFTLSNPFNQLLADRNLYVSNLSFVPKARR